MKNFLITEEEKNKILRMHNLMTEDETSATQQLNSILSRAGISLSPEEVDELKAGCVLDMSELSPEDQRLAQDYENRTSNMTDEDAEQELIKSQQLPIQEQGLSPQQTKVAYGFVGLWTLYLLIRVFKGLFGGRGNKTCRKINRRYKRRGIKGIT